MEDILSVYARSYNKNRPVVCMDEKPYQLIGNTRESLRMKSGAVQKVDYEYKRNGTCSIFIFTEPLNCWRYLQAFYHRTKMEWAYCIRWLLNEQYPDAEKLVLVMDNLNTHTLSSLYEAFLPEEAHRLAQRLEIHYTPKHGSWLNIAEIELSALSLQCLGQRRIPNMQTLNKELAAWHIRRNQNQKGVDWHFTTHEARKKLKKLYPIIL